MSISIQVSGRLQNGQLQLEGTLTQVPTKPNGGALSVRMRARDGQDWTLALGLNSMVRYSEGDPAPPDVVRPGMAVSVSGAASGDVVVVSEMMLRSVSRTGASLSYAVQPGGGSIRISGTGWPPERSVALTIARSRAFPSATVG